MDMLKNPVKEKLARGGAAVGIFVGMSDPRLVEICGLAGFDYVLLDAEHSPFSERELEHLVRAAQVAAIPAFVRVPANRHEVILRIMDVGAWGVMIPQVKSRTEAEEAVAAVKYAPLGSRGSSVPRIAGFGTAFGFREWTEISNRESMVIIQIEHREAVENLDEILKVPGVDAFELGQADLSQSLGLPGATSDPKVREYVDRAVKKILDAGRVLGDTTTDPVEAAAFLDRGYRMVACSLHRLVHQGGKKFVDGVRASSSASGGVGRETARV
jgi:4-hydroxy-2-oxoheptanedioate aldolase